MRIVVMGVTGCGKSTVGALLADALGAEFADGDDFHSRASVAKMAKGEPLTDDDRWPWLEEIGAWLASREDAVVACSALTRSYRDAIRGVAGGTTFIHLTAPQSVLEDRVRVRAERDGHFAGPGLLDSQYATLQALGELEAGISIDVALHTATEATAVAAEWLRL